MTLLLSTRPSTRRAALLGTRGVRGRAANNSLRVSARSVSAVFSPERTPVRSVVTVCGSAISVTAVRAFPRLSSGNLSFTGTEMVTDPSSATQPSL